MTTPVEHSEPKFHYGEGVEISAGELNFYDGAKGVVVYSEIDPEVDQGESRWYRVLLQYGGHQDILERYLIPNDWNVDRAFTFIPPGSNVTKTSCL